MADDGDHAVGDELLRHRERLLAIAVVVGGDSYDRLTENAAGVVEFGHRQFDTALMLLPVPRHLTCQRRRGADQDLGAGDGSHSQRHGGGHETNARPNLHGRLPLLRRRRCLSVTGSPPSAPATRTRNPSTRTTNGS